MKKNSRELLEKKLTLKMGLDKRKCEQSLHYFVRRCFKWLEPNTKFVDGEHIHEICSLLERCEAGLEPRIIINIPPRWMKSLIVSVIFPIWVWTKRPEEKFIFSSYNKNLSINLNLKRRRIIRSPWFREYFGHIITITDDQDKKTEFENTKGGKFLATSTGAGVAGEGGGYVIADDPQDPEMADSSIDREDANASCHYLKTRLNGQDSRYILIQQRVHHDDSTHSLIENSMEKFKVVEYKALDDNGESAWPDRFSTEHVMSLKESLGSHKFSAQYMQNPTPEGGMLLQGAWFKRFKDAPDGGVSGWFWDTAVKTKETNDYSVGIFVKEVPGGLYILDLIRGKWIYPDLKQIVRDAFNSTEASFVKVEDKSSGQQLIQDFGAPSKYGADKTERPIPCLLYKPVSDKIQRVSVASPTIEAGKVHIPQDAPWARDFIEEVEHFPRGRHDDQVDALTMAIDHFVIARRVGSFSNISNKISQNKPKMQSLRSTKPIW